MKRPVFWAMDALDDIKRQVSFIAAENATAAITLSEKLRETGEALGVMAIGRPGRVPGTFEKSIVGLPYVLAYAVQQATSKKRWREGAHCHSARHSYRQGMARRHLAEDKLIHHSTK